MASAEIGGDSSVQWVIKADHVRMDPKPESAPVQPNGWRQSGTDESDFGAEVGFFITLMMPKDPRNAETFVRTLCEACAAAKVKQGTAGACIQFILPIEGGSPNQIVIDWKSAP